MGCDAIATAEDLERPEKAAAVEAEAVSRVPGKNAGVQEDCTIRRLEQEQTTAANTGVVDQSTIYANCLVTGC